MNSRKKLYISSLISFFVGVVVASVFSFYLYKGMMEFAVYSEMLEDFSQSIAIISYFNMGEPEHSLELARQILEASCETYVMDDYSEDVRLGAEEYVTRAKELGYCQ